MSRTVLLLVCTALSLSGCGGPAGTSASRTQIRIVGSSTVYPFATAVAEKFVSKNAGFNSPIVESTGTGAGMKLFCAGTGTGFPDIANTSRRMKASEFADCQKNGVAEVTEVQIGIDGIALAEAKAGPALALTTLDLYKALAANPFGKPNTSKSWKDVNPALPATPISVYGPPTTSGTRDAFAELVLEKGCDSDSAMKALKGSDKDKHKDICTKIREDGVYVDAGENDNLIVQKVERNSNALGIFGYSFLEENLSKLKDVSLNGVSATYDTISSFKYPGARPLYIYIKNSHLKVIPGMREFVSEFASSWGPTGYLKGRGMIVAPDDVRAKSEAVSKAMNPLDPATLK